MANILQLPHEVLILIFRLLDSPGAFTAACRALNAFSRDQSVISCWLMCDPNIRAHHFNCILEISVLERFVSAILDLRLKIKAG